MKTTKPDSNPMDPSAEPSVGVQFGPGVVPTFLYYFSGTTLLFTLVTARSLGLAVGSGLPQQVGLLGGVVAGLAGAYFNRTIVRSLPAANCKTLQAQLTDILSRMGYQPGEAVDGVQVYERSGLSRVFSGRVFVQSQGQDIRVAGRSLQVKAIQKALQS